MKGRYMHILRGSWMGMAACLFIAAAQPPGGPPPNGFGGPPGGPGGPMGVRREILKDYDKDGDGKLNKTERVAALAFLASQPARRFGPRGGGEQTPPEPGPRLSPKDVKAYTTEPFYDPDTLRTLFLEFDSPDWEKEMAAFYHTDVDIPARLTVDGKVYPEVGVRFRGASSFMMTPEGRKRSLNISIDYADDSARLGGYRTLNLLNANGDPTLLRSVLYLQIARNYIPAPKANFVRVVINGEFWGIYPNVQQYNSDFVKEWFQTTKGARWKTPGSPMGRAGLAYLGDDPAAYKRLYEIKSKDNAKSWTALINLCKVLNQTPPDKLEAALEPILDIDGALKFLALDKALINNDGYWARASDYSIYLDEKGKFHVFPHDANETLEPAEMMGMGRGRGPGGFRPGGPAGMGGPGGPGGFGGPPPGFAPRGPEDGRGPGGPPAGFKPPPENATLDPFAGADDPNKALLHRLLAVPALRKRYMDCVREIASTWLDWNRLGPIATKYQSLIAPGVRQDTRKLYSTGAFEKGLTEETEFPKMGPFGGGSHMSMRRFAEERRKFLLGYQDKGPASKQEAPKN
ncbi:MAG TPA: CotH kinase family protein [Bryobacteraceae bacterium]|nr:CotH kinase family protein [Bryobacteraceae bacterium]